MTKKVTENNVALLFSISKEKPYLCIYLFYKILFPKEIHHLFFPTHQFAAHSHAQYLSMCYIYTYKHTHKLKLGIVIIFFSPKKKRKKKKKGQVIMAATIGISQWSLIASFSQKKSDTVRLFPKGKFFLRYG